MIRVINYFPSSHTYYRRIEQICGGVLERGTYVIYYLTHNDKNYAPEVLHDVLLLQGDTLFWVYNLHVFVVKEVRWE